MTEKELWLKQKELTNQVLEELKDKINYDAFLHIFEDNYNWFSFLGITEEDYKDISSRVRKENQEMNKVKILIK